jgi:hypothetical protein
MSPSPAAPVPSPVQVRRFERPDRDHVTDLVNAHIGAVVPNISVSVSGLLSYLEREPGEYVVDPWVADRVTLVAEQRRRIVAAAHLLRYADDDRVGPAYRNLGEIRWLVCWPDAPSWPDAGAAGRALTAACLAQLTRWRVARWGADGTLPAPGVYGVPEQWPHVHDLLRGAGFTGHRTETVVAARLDALPCPRTGALPGLTARRTLGVAGTRFEALLDGRRVGYVEVESRDDAPRTQGARIWADIGNLDLGGVTRLMSYLAEGDDGEAAFYAARGFLALTRTVRDYGRDPTPRSSGPRVETAGPAPGRG